MSMLREFVESVDVTAVLQRGGLSEEAARAHAPYFEMMAKRLIAGGAPRDAAVLAYFVPGRIEVLGKHTDYAGGDSLVCATERGFCFMAAPAVDPTIVIDDVVRGESVCIGAPDKGAPHAWARYPDTVLRRCASNFGPLSGGARIVFAGTLPADAGLSSSSALIVGCYLALCGIFELDADIRYREAVASRLELADYLGHVENGQTYKTLAGERGVGTFGGSQDHTAILCSEPGAVVRYQYAPTCRRGAASVPDQLVFVVATSGVQARKAGDAQEDYNRASLLAVQIAVRWNAVYDASACHLREIVDSPDFTPAEMERILLEEPVLARRFRHFYAEHTQLVPGAFQAVSRGDWKELGMLADRSQALAETLLGNQIAETATLVRLARSGGACAASAFGAGFGGAVWALIQASEAEAFRSRWLHDYRQAFPHRKDADAFVTRPGPPAFSLDLVSD